ncbi:hypothetical protein RU97_GL000701 [Enterococcus canis]|uniref:Uncharacterized protein n=1 Tax=Enterococcus canis TaxID=214095 RepID=A0A1L8RH84_9ENTE|nr:hypothetical protein [Enterococcus canis]OJG19130.1 hypothetical protein RU97_GL000701 [Enterococcus canis]
MTKTKKFLLSAIVLAGVTAGVAFSSETGQAATIDYQRDLKRIINDELVIHNDVLGREMTKAESKIFLDTIEEEKDRLHTDQLTEEIIHTANKAAAGEKKTLTLKETETKKSSSNHSKMNVANTNTYKANAFFRIWHNLLQGKFSL